MARSAAGPAGRGRATRPARMTTIKEEISYLDIALLQRFLTERGRIKSRRQTRLSRRQQAEVARAIKRARELALLPYSRQGTEGRGGRRGGDAR